MQATCIQRANRNGDSSGPGRDGGKASLWQYASDEAYLSLTQCGECGSCVYGVMLSRLFSSTLATIGSRPRKLVQMK